MAESIGISGFQSFQMGSTQSPFSAINAAIDALVMVTNVSGVSATDAKTLTVTFNQAISAADQALATFTVKKGTTPVPVTATWAADGKSVKLAKSTNLIAGTYTVTVGGFDLGVDTATTDVVAQKVAGIQIPTSNVKVGDAESIYFTVTDQYGTELAKAGNLFNWSVVNTTSAARTATITPSASTTQKFVAIDTNEVIPCQVGDVLRVTALLTSDPTVIVTKEITVSNIYTNTFTFGEVVLPEGADKLMQNAGYVELGYVAADNLGNDVTLSDRVASTTNNAFNGIQFFTSDASIVPVLSTADVVVPTIEGFKVVDGKLYVKVLNKSGDVTLTALNTNTGAATTKTITVNKTATPTTVEFGEFVDDSVISGDAAGTAKLGITFFDQYGNALTNKTYNMETDFNVTVSGAGATPLDPAAALTNGYMTFNDNLVTAGTYTITLVNKTTGTAVSKQVVVNEARVPNELKVVTTPQATIIAGGTTKVNFDVIDQYGDAMADAAAYQVVATNTNGAAIVEPDNADTFTIPQIIVDTTIEAGVAGTATVTYTLEKTVGHVAVDAAAFNFTVVADAAAFVVETNNTTYTAGDSIEVTVKAEKPAGTVYTSYNETHTATVTVEGKDYIRTLAFVNGVVTTTVPATNAATVADVDVTFDSNTYAAADVKVVAAAASKFILAGDTGHATLTPTLQDAYGNTIDTFDGDKILKVTYPAAANITGSGIDAEGNVVKTFTDGVGANITFGANLPAGTYTVTYGSYTGTLTLV